MREILLGILLCAGLAFASDGDDARNRFEFESETDCAAQVLQSRFLLSGLVPERSDSLWYFSRDLDFLTGAVFDREPWPQMNIRPLDAKRWLAVDAEPRHAYLDLLQRRRRILASVEREKVILSLPDPEIRTAAMALLKKTIAYLGDNFPHYYRVSGNRIENILTGDVFDGDDDKTDPLEAFALLTTNDVLIAKADKNDLKLAAAAVLFTASWNPGSLLGKPLRSIHEMEGATEKFHSGVEKVMKRLASDPSLTVLRNNWFWRTDPTLFQHLEMDWVFPSIPVSPTRARNIGDRLYIRMERETFSSIPGFPTYIAFTLDSKVYPLRALAKIPEVAARTLAGLDRNPGGTVLSQHTNLLREYLRIATSKR